MIALSCDFGSRLLEASRDRPNRPTQQEPAREPHHDEDAQGHPGQEQGPRGLRFGELRGRRHLLARHPEGVLDQFHVDVSRPQVPPEVDGLRLRGVAGRERQDPAFDPVGDRRVVCPKSCEERLQVIPPGPCLRGPEMLLRVGVRPLLRGQPAPPCRIEDEPAHNVPALEVVGAQAAHGRPNGEGRGL